MKIQLIDKNIIMCEEWHNQFQFCDDVIIHYGDIFSLETDCIVSPANSYGFMNGALDLIISEKIGWQVQEKLQQQIIKKYDGELLVGQAEIIETEYNKIPYCISAPTMRVPMLLGDSSINVYLATKAIFNLLKKNTQIQTITISGLGTGVGKVPFNLCAKQMKQAYDDIWLNMNEFPKTWKDAQNKHISLYEKNRK